MKMFNNNSKPKDKKWSEKKHTTQAPAKTASTSKASKTATPKVVYPPAPAKERNSQVVKKVSDTPRVIDPDLEFQLMYGLSDVANEVTEKKETKNEVDVTSSDKTIPAGTGTGFVKSFFPKTVYKKLVNKKLNIILIENTAAVSKEKGKVLQIINRFLNCDLLCIINYTDTVYQSEILEVPEQHDQMNIDYTENNQENACLFDALVEAEKIVSSKYLVTEDKEKERVCVGEIEIIGIGTCTDNCSTSTKEAALEAFFKIVNKRSKISTKYFCITDANVMNAAEIGFHSIGSISIVYQ